MRFMIVGMGILGVFHYYAWLRWVQEPAWGPSVFWTLTAASVLFWLSVPVTMLARSRLSPGLARVWVWPGYLWLGTVFVATVVLALTDLTRTLLWVLARVVSPVWMEAQWALPPVRAWALGSALIVLSLLLYSVWQARGRARVERVEVVLSRLPEALDGMRVVQLTDVHIGLTLGRRFAERVVEAVNRLEPDVIVITGDLVDGTVERLASAVAPLSRLSAAHGVYFVTGNHEYYSGGQAWCEHLSSMGLTVLRNERVSIGQGRESFDLAGVDDYSAHAFGGGHGADLARALSGRDPSRELLLLAHQPRAVVEAAAHGVGLQLSGHTHGGQIWPFNHLVPLQQPVVAGLSQIGDTQIYVSRGTGYWGPPMRLGSPPEISELVLRSGRRVS